MVLKADLRHRFSWNDFDKDHYDMVFFGVVRASTIYMVAKRSYSKRDAIGPIHQDNKKANPNNASVGVVSNFLDNITSRLTIVRDGYRRHYIIKKITKVHW